MSSELTDQLDIAGKSLWQQYIQLEEQNLRKDALEVLDQFIGILLGYPKPERDNWVRTICRLVSDEGIHIPIRYPLFGKVICPYLVQAYHRQEPSAARWLAYFHEWFYASNPCADSLGKADFSQINMLREAFAHDPNDSLARKRLIHEMARNFDYAIHEVPSGVLCGIDGASIEDCEAMLKDLQTFRRLIELEGEDSRYAERMRTWEFHFQEYANYLANRNKYKNYADYLERHP
jgi:hypothetical protein